MSQRVDNLIISDIKQDRQIDYLEKRINQIDKAIDALLRYLELEISPPRMVVSKKEAPPPK